MHTKTAMSKNTVQLEKLWYTSKTQPDTGIYQCTVWKLTICSKCVTFQRHLIEEVTNDCTTTMPHNNLWHLLTSRAKPLDRSQHAFKEKIALQQWSEISRARPLDSSQHAFKEKIK